MGSNIILQKNDYYPKNLLKKLTLKYIELSAYRIFMTGWNYVFYIPVFAFTDVTWDVLKAVHNISSTFR